jgi:hypothetical protein
VENFGFTIGVLGAVSLVAALAGGLSFADIRFPALTSPPLRWALAIVGLILLVAGFLMIRESRATVDPAFTPPDSSTSAGVSDPTTQSSPRSQSTTGPEPSDANYVSQANASCAASTRRVVGLSAPSSDDSDQSWIEYTFSYAEILETLAQDLGRLTPPAASSEKHNGLLFHLQLMTESLNSAAVALRAGDQTGYQTHSDNADQYQTTFNRFARQLSLGDCQFG